MSDDPELRIALVVAGGVSLGAFNAGALIQLIALLERQAAAPARIDVLSGTSAGSMTLAVMLRALAGGQDAGGLADALTQAGVTAVGLDYLSPGDPRQLAPNLQNHDELGLLSSRPIRRVLRRLVVEAPRLGEPHPLLGPEVRCSLALSNLHGVDLRDPARVGVNVHGENPAADAITTSWFDDAQRFVFRPGATSGAIEDGAILLGAVDAHPAWETLAEAARASGAFPVAFPPVRIERQREELGDFWPEDLDDRGSYRFVYADGGLFRNEPLDEALVQAAQLDAADDRPHHRVVILIDPNVRGPLSVRALDHERDWNLVDGLLGPKLEPRSTASKLLGYASHLSRIFKYQAESKPALRTGLGRGTHVVAITPLTPPESITLAGAFMANFGGFLAEDWRRQDLAAGRYAADEVLRRCHRGGAGASPGLPRLIAPGGEHLPRPRVDSPTYHDAPAAVRARFDRMLRDHLGQLASAHGAPGVLGEWVGQAVMRYLERELKTPPMTTRYVTLRLGPVADDRALLPAKRASGAAEPVLVRGQLYLETLLALDHCPRSLDPYRLRGPHLHRDHRRLWLEIGEAHVMTQREEPHRIAIDGLARTWFEAARENRLLAAPALAERIDPSGLT